MIGRPPHIERHPAVELPAPHGDLMTTTPQHHLVTGLAGVPLDAYDALELLSQRADDEPAQILSAAARTVADLWNDPGDGMAMAIQEEIRQGWPQLADALYELLGGGPLTPPITLADCRLEGGA